MAQLGARFHGMEEVVGSNPTRSTTSLLGLSGSRLRARALLGSARVAHARKPRKRLTKNSIISTCQMDENAPAGLQKKLTKTVAEPSDFRTDLTAILRGSEKA